MTYRRRLLMSKRKSEERVSDNSTEKGRLQKGLSLFKDYSGLIVAIATIALALITYFHMNEAKEMREATKNMATETKRLADISIEQFKIKSYPTFRIVVGDLSVDSSGIRKVFKVANKGEITAHNVTFLIADVYKTKNVMQIHHDLRAFYESNDEARIVNFESKICSDSEKIIVGGMSFVKPYTIENFKCVLLYIKFKVPYDEKYRYESYAYVLKKRLKKPETQKDSYYLQYMTVGDTNELVKRDMMAIKTLTGKAKELVERFFCDFSAEKQEQGD